MHLNKISGVVVAAAITGGALVLPTSASAATPSAHASSVVASAPYVTVTTPATYLPYTKVAIEGTATPDSPLMLDMPGAALYRQRIRSDATGHWSFTLDRVLSGSFGSNVVTLLSPDGRAAAQATFTLTGEYPQPTDAAAAFRPIAVTSTARVSATSSRVSGTATPGALVVVRGVGYAQSVTTAGTNGEWSVTLSKAAAGDMPWNEFAAYQTHANGADKTVFTLAG